MFRAKTVLVLGAGASCEVGLPAGDTLLKNIAHLLTYEFELNEPSKGDRIIFAALKARLDEGREFKKLNEHLIAAEQIVRSASQALSIDNVIDMLEDERAETVGKLAISRVILDAEASSDYFKGDPNRVYELIPSRFSKTWYSSFTKLVTEGVRRSAVHDVFTNLSIINFNYDRCLEHYLPYSLASYYGIPLDEAQSIVDKLPIYRPYGRVGKLPWQSGNEPSIPFGQRGVAETNAAALQLRTFTEQVEGGDTIERIHRSLIDADRIVFLGFAFHRQNLRLLTVDRDEMPEVIATALNVSNSDQEVIKTELTQTLGIGTFAEEQDIELFGEPCAALFMEYWRTLTAEARG